MKFQPIDRPIPIDEDAVLTYMDENDKEEVIFGVINPETNQKEPIIKLSENEKIVINARTPFFLKTNNGMPSLDINFI